MFGVFCRRWGVPLIDGGTVRLPRLIGAVARDGHDPDRPRRRRARGARRWGSPTASSRTARAWPPAQELARELAALPQTCLRQDRLSLLEQEGLDEAAALANELGHGVRSLEDVQAGARAVPRRRRPARLVRMSRARPISFRVGRRSYDPEPWLSSAFTDHCRGLAGGRAELEVGGATVHELLRGLEDLHPSVAGWILDERGVIRRHINVFVNGERGRRGRPRSLRTIASRVLPAITGG